MSYENYWAGQDKNHNIRLTGQNTIYSKNINIEVLLMPFWNFKISEFWQLTYKNVVSLNNISFNIFSFQLSLWNVASDSRQSCMYLFFANFLDPSYMAWRTSTIIFFRRHSGAKRKKSRYLRAKTLAATT